MEHINPISLLMAEVAGEDQLLVQDAFKKARLVNELAIVELPPDI
jgi:hypothetical protein